MKVLFFARARDLAGIAEADLELAPGIRVADVRMALARRYPALASLLPHCALAVNDDYAADEAILGGAERVAVLPPVSGG